MLSSEVVPSYQPSLLRDYPFPRLPAAGSGNLVCRSDSVLCPNLSGWGGVKGRGWPPHMPGAFQRLTPELLSFCALAVLTDNAFIPAGRLDNCSHMPLARTDWSSSRKLVFLQVHLSWKGFGWTHTRSRLTSPLWTSACCFFLPSVPSTAINSASTAN